MEFFDELEELLGFGRPIGLRFNVGGTKDIMPVCWDVITNKDGEQTGYKAICRTIGIDKDDVKIKLQNDGILIEGSTEYEGEKYDTHYKLPIAKNVISDIKSIDYKVLNGLTYIYLHMNKPEKKNVSINQL